jgi:vanillate O-demethylase ferredoxin subunit
MTNSWIDVCIAHKGREAEGIFSFDLVNAADAELPPFEAGAHIDIRLPNGMTRQYSLCNSPDERSRYQIALQREEAGRGGSICLCDTVERGDVLRIGAPRNNFPLVTPARRSLLLAGGIGVTPMLAMVEVLWNRNAEFTLHYGARTRSRMAFTRRLAAAAFADRVVLHLDDEPETRLDLAEAIGSPESDAHVYVCGPKGFIDAAMDTARSAGWSAPQLHFELFSAAVEPRADDGGFYVELARSGGRVFIPPDKTVAEALDAAGVPIEVSCEQGICGTCLTRVLAGEPDHRDLFMNDEEHARNDSFTPCCSRARSAVLVIDR